MTRHPRSPLRRRTAGARSSRALTRHAQRGVALIEALVSILIFSFGVIGLAGLEARAISFSADAEDRNRAALLANEIASSMWLANTVALSTATYTAFQASAADPRGTGLPNGVLTVSTVAGTTNVANIKLTWHAPSRLATDVSVLTTQVILP